MSFPHSKWIKIRKKLRKYPKTPQQKNIKLSGEMISAKCEGLKGKEFAQCRSEILQCVWHRICSLDLTELKDQLKRNINQENAV